MCECLSYDDGSEYLCEACGPRWREYEASLSRPSPPAAPLDLAVKEARKAKRYDFRDVGISYVADWCPVPDEHGDWVHAEVLVDLLAALDADKRLEEAEAALRPFADPESYSTTEEECRRNTHMDWCAIHSFRWPCPVDAARRYFARREGKETTNG